MVAQPAHLPGGSPIPLFEFSLVVDGISATDPEHDDRLRANGAEDAMVFGVGGVTHVAFYREASTAQQALWAAVDAIEAAYPDAAVCRLDRDLVSTSDIASRIGKSREIIRLYVEGARGPGGFPPPVGVVGAARRIWEWAAVHNWLSAAGLLEEAEDEAVPVPLHEAVDFDYRLAAHSQLERAEVGFLRTRKREPDTLQSGYVHVFLAAGSHSQWMMPHETPRPVFDRFWKEVRAHDVIGSETTEDLPYGSELPA